MMQSGPVSIKKLLMAVSLQLGDSYKELYEALGVDMTASQRLRFEKVDKFIDAKKKKKMKPRAGIVTSE